MGSTYCDVTRRVHLHAVFDAYFDASGDRNKSVLTMAGFVSRKKKWERFEDTWKALLPPTVNMFHMTDFVNSRKGWESWKGPEHSQRRAVLIDNLAECIKSATNKGFAQSVRISHYEECDKEYKLAAPSSCRSTPRLRLARYGDG